MKKHISLWLFLFTAAFTVSGQNNIVPPLNAKVIQYVNTKIGKKVDSGECWDLAAKALEHAKATHTKTYVFGKVISKNEKTYPGDIIQFKGVKLKQPISNGYKIIVLDHHTAIVYEVLDKLKFKVADQNNEIAGKKVAISELDLNNLLKGKFTIYRPLEK